MCCPCCQAERTVIDHEDSEVLEIEPMRFKVIRYRRQKVACKSCRDGGVVVAPPGDRVWDRTLAGPHLLSQLVVSKFEDHVPINRFRTMAQRIGVDIAESTLSAWVARVGEDLVPLEEACWNELWQAFLIRTDASGIPVLDREHENGIVRGTMWCYVGDDRIVSFRYTEDANGSSGPWSALAGREGYVQADAANVFDALYDGREATAKEVGCWAHCRRKFWKLKDDDPRAEHGVQLIARLYRVETLADVQAMTPEERRALRQQRSVPALERIKHWLGKMERTSTPKSEMAKAARYGLKHWGALTRFLDDGRLGLDNNFCELQIRSLAIGRRAWLFAGSHRAARNSARLYGLLRTCAVNRVNPEEWLEDVLWKLGRGWPESRLKELLPQHWGKRQPKKVEPAEAG